LDLQPQEVRVMKETMTQDVPNAEIPTLSQEQLDDVAGGVGDVLWG